MRLFLAAVMAALWVSPGRADDSVWSGTDLRPLHAPMPAFPERMLLSGIDRGMVELMIEVTPAGEVADVLITGYTNRAFATTTLATVERWRFAPGNVGHVVHLTLNFETRGMIAYVRRYDPEAERPADYTFEPCPPERLDARPRPIETVAPPYGPNVASAGGEGVVTLDYFIDEQGRVRMPVTAEAPHPLLAGLAISALKQWRFEPPTCDGRPALVRARQSFRFGEPTS